MMVWLLFIIDLMGLFFYTKIGSIISIGDLPTTNIIEPQKRDSSFCTQISCLRQHEIPCQGFTETRHRTIKV